MIYKRSNELERSADRSAGEVRGILASDGEASDGHILSVDGGTLHEGSPMLFGHDDFSGSRNLGSWHSFEKTRGDTGGRVIRAEGTIGLGGAGAQQAWRKDVDYMIGQRAITGLSLRWEPTGDPIRRTSLPSDHHAHVGRKDKGRRANGLFFPEWDMTEGSVVTLGSDRAAVIGRMAESTGEVRAYYRDALNDALIDETDSSAELVSVALANGEFAFAERSVYDALMELANERYSLALDIYERMVVGIDPPESVEIEANRSVEAPALVDPLEPDSSAKADLQKERETPSATLPDVTPRMMLAYLREGLAKARTEVLEINRAALDHARGKV